jgi:hypothetical protein
MINDPARGFTIGDRRDGWTYEDDRTKRIHAVALWHMRSRSHCG